jgi:hypothetical protein
MLVVVTKYPATSATIRMVKVFREVYVPPGPNLSILTLLTLGVRKAEV